MLRRVMSLSASLKSLSVTSTRLSTNQIADLEDKLSENPYFIKFKDRIVTLKESDPDTYVKRLELMLNQHQKQKKKDIGNMG